jgi:hypothetical protein
MGQLCHNLSTTENVFDPAQVDTNAGWYGITYSHQTNCTTTPWGWVQTKTTYCTKPSAVYPKRIQPCGCDVPTTMVCKCFTSRISLTHRGMNEHLDKHHVLDVKSRHDKTVLHDSRLRNMVESDPMTLKKNMTLPRVAQLCIPVIDHALSHRFVHRDLTVSGDIGLTIVVRKKTGPVRSQLFSKLFVYY